MASPAASASAMPKCYQHPQCHRHSDRHGHVEGGDDVRSSVGKALPRTGGASLMPLVSAAALVLLVGSGTVATRLVRRGR
jgi:hypothetical protein